MSKLTRLALPLLAIAAAAISSAAPAFADVGTSAPAASPAFTTSGTDLGTLLDNPATKAVVVKYLPNIANNPQLGLARSLTLRQLQTYAPDKLSDDTLAKIDTDLAQVPTSK